MNFVYPAGLPKTTESGAASGNGVTRRQLHATGVLNHAKVDHVLRHTCDIRNSARFGSIQEPWHHICSQVSFVADPFFQLGHQSDYEVYECSCGTCMRIPSPLVTLGMRCGYDPGRIRSARDVFTLREMKPLINYSGSLHQWWHE